MPDVDRGNMCTRLCISNVLPIATEFPGFEYYNHLLADFINTRLLYDIYVLKASVLFLEYF